MPCSLFESALVSTGRKQPFGQRPVSIKLIFAKENRRTKTFGANFTGQNVALGLLTPKYLLHRKIKTRPRAFKRKIFDPESSGAALQTHPKRSGEGVSFFAKYVIIELLRDCSWQSALEIASGSSSGFTEEREKGRRR